MSTSPLTGLDLDPDLCS